MHPCSRHSAAGATLVELIVTIVIVSIALTGVLVGIDRITRSSADPMVYQQSLALADSYLEEIMLKAYADPDGSGPPDDDCAAEEGDRGDYDDVGDYAGLSDQPPEDQTGDPFSDLAGYAVSVSVTCNDAVNGRTAKRIVVTVSHDVLPADVVLTSFRTNI